MLQTLGTKHTFIYSKPLLIFNIQISFILESLNAKLPLLCYNTYITIVFYSLESPLPFFLQLFPEWTV